MARTIIAGFKLVKDNKVVDEFYYSRRGNVYEIFNNSGNLFSDNSYIESEKYWNRITTNFSELCPKMGVKLETKKNGEKMR